MTFRVLVTLLISAAFALAADKAPANSEQAVVDDTLCAVDRTAANAAHAAAQAKDREALAELIQRGKIKPLRKGARIKILIVEEPWRYGRVLTGGLAGERCWVPLTAF